MKPSYTFTVLASVMFIAACDTATNAAAPETTESRPKTVIEDDRENGIAGAILVGEEVAVLYSKSKATDSDILNIANKMCGDELGKKAGSMRAEPLTHDYPAAAGFDSKVFVNCI